MAALGLTMPSLSTGAALGAGGSALLGGKWLFSYNRGNYKFDQKLHFGRFTTGASLACAQTGMYRQDIGDMAELTCARMDVYHCIAGMIATILTAVYCPGRVGLHTPAPPGWLMGLFMVNIAGCYVYLGLTMWLAMHASLRAETSATHMLTRFVRLPIPANWMLDRARKLLASYEEQKLREVFRIPFFRHKGGKSGDGEAAVDEGARRRTRGGASHLGDDVPAWYSKEKDVDRNFGMESMPLQARSGGNCPQHFEVFREMQQEWWPYDVYARLSIFLAFMHLTSTYCFHQLGHHFAETRSVFAVGCVILPVTILQQLILTLDICPAQLNDPYNFPFHRIVSAAPWFAYIATALEYKRWYTSEGLAWSAVFAILAYVVQILYTLQLLRICAPDPKAPEQMDSPGAAWWPASWCIPSSFQHSIWLVAPPKSLSTGLNDLVGEMREGSDNKTNNKPTNEEKRRDVHTALGPKGESPAWFNVRVGLMSLLVAWVWLTIGYIVELSYQGTATPSLINAPGLPNNLRDPRYRPIKPGMHEVVEVGTGGWVHGPVVGIPGSDDSGGHRRLQQVDAPPEALAEKVAALLPYLDQIARGGHGLAAAAGRPNATEAAAALPHAAQLPQAPSGLARAQIQWPALFEPRLVASGPEAHMGMMALSRHGRGVLITALEEQMAAETRPFALSGAAAFGPLLSASWDASGLLLTVASGVVLECPGQGPSSGYWACEPIHGAKLPIGTGGMPFRGAVALQRHPAGEVGGLRAAVVFPGDSSVTLFTRAARAAAPWLPAGEVRAHKVPVSASFATGNTLLLTSADGAVTHMDMNDGSMVHGVVPSSGEGHSWHGACHHAGGRVARLASRSGGLGGAEPVLFIG